MLIMFFKESYYLILFFAAAPVFKVPFYKSHCSHLQKLLISLQFCNKYKCILSQPDLNTNEKWANFFLMFSKLLFEASDC